MSHTPGESADRQMQGQPGPQQRSQRRSVRRNLVHYFVTSQENSLFCDSQKDTKIFASNPKHRNFSCRCEETKLKLVRSWETHCIQLKPVLTMTLPASLLRELVNPNLDVGGRAELCCNLSREFENKGEYEEAREILSGLWPRTGQRPRVKGLEPDIAAEVLLRAGVLTGWISSDQIADAQEQAKDFHERKPHDLRIPKIQKENR